MSPRFPPFSSLHPPPKPCRGCFLLEWRTKYFTSLLLICVGPVSAGSQMNKDSVSHQSQGWPAKVKTGRRRTMFLQKGEKENNNKTNKQTNKKKAIRDVRKEWRQRKETNQTGRIEKRVPTYTLHIKFGVTVRAPRCGKRDTSRTLEATASPRQSVGLILFILFKIWFRNTSKQLKQAWKSSSSPTLSDSWHWPGSGRDSCCFL